MKIKNWVFGGFISLAFLVGCGQNEDKRIAPKARKINLDFEWSSAESSALKKLSEYGFFEGDLAELTPVSNVYPYSINTPLFSNYAEKERFVFIPTKKKITFRANGLFSFEEGTVLIKNFYYPEGLTDSSNSRKIIETRLLILENKNWIPLNYVWNEQQTEATLNYVGKTELVNWIDSNGEKKEVYYKVPNLNQCKNCHNSNNTIVPIGLTAAQLNKYYKPLGDKINQLDYFKKTGVLSNFTHSSEVSKMPVWNDPKTGSVDERSRAYLDANCAHCHSSQGSAKNSGLYLDYHEKDTRKRGIFKPPVAAGKGSGNFQYGIVPGKPQESIFIYRLISNDPAIRMPEIGRSIPHQEGISLLTTYIKELKEE